MRYHKALSAARLREMPWKTLVGMVASELGRTARLLDQGGGPEMAGCLQRARELLGVLESLSSVPAEPGLILAGIAEELAPSKLQDAPQKAREIHRRLMIIC